MPYSQSRKEYKKYQCIHMWIIRHKSKPDVCELCDENKKLELANISGEYKRDINDYHYFCSQCHRDFDKVNQIHKRSEI